MLIEVADGVLVHESAWLQSNTVVVRGGDGALIVDPGVHESEITGLAGELSEAGQTVVAGFSTHPHWDHLLWHELLGSPPRLATALAAATARERLSGGIDAARFGIPPDVSLDLLGKIEGLPVGQAELPWFGPVTRILEHRAHAPGHAGLLVEDARVLVAGDMLSDVFIPMLDLRDSGDPIGDYLAALDLLEGVTGEVDVVVPGHGSVGDGVVLRERIARDRAYLVALRDGGVIDDPRIGPSVEPGWEFVRDVHERQVEALAR